MVGCICFARPEGQCIARIFAGPFRAMVARDLTQAKAWAMLSWPFGPQNHRGARVVLTGSMTARRANMR